jgi:hypothetical protein
MQDLLWNTDFSATEASRLMTETAAAAKTNSSSVMARAPVIENICRSTTVSRRAKHRRSDDRAE